MLIFKINLIFFVQYVILTISKMERVTTMRSKDVEYSVFIGDVALDEYYQAPRWPSIKDKTMVETLPAVPGGMIANAACVSAALGIKTVFCTKLNSGPVSQLLLNDLNRQGLDTSMTVFDDSLPDSKTMIFLVGDEHTIFIPDLHVNSIELTEEQLEILKNAKYIYSTSGGLSLLRSGNLVWPDIRELCHEAGAKFVVDYDVDYERNSDDNRFKGIDIGFFNEVGYDSVRKGTSYEQQAKRLHELGMSIVVVTLAENGCVVYTQENEYRAAAKCVPVVDVTGAGDTFCSSFIAVLDKLGIQKAAEFANTAASICVSSMGARAGAVSFEQVESVL